MSFSWPLILLLVFTVHLPFFFYRWWTTRDMRHGSTLVVFVLLVAMYSLRVFAPEARIGGMLLWEAVRVLVIPAGVVSLGTLAHYLLIGRHRT